MPASQMKISVSGKRTVPRQPRSNKFLIVKKVKTK